MTDPMLDQILEAAAAVFERPVRSSDNFFAIGGDSLLAAELAVELEERAGCPVDPEVILASATFCAIASALTDTNRIPAGDDHA